MSYEDWIGKTASREDVITQRLIDSLHVTFAPFCSDSDMPEGVFWCLCPDIEPASALGPDGHPMLGKYLPDLGFERRMWAGGDITFHLDLQPFIPITRQSSIKSITPKKGRSGEMVFVTIAHHYFQSNRLCIEEIQNLVYREAVTKSAAPIRQQDYLADAQIAHKWTLCPDSTMLFRYSALTFNGHRIHYDKDFSIAHEGHDGLIIHGPIQATLLMSLAQSKGSQKLKHFSYRSTAALTCGHHINVIISKMNEENNRLMATGAICDHKGHVTMTATMELVK